MLPQYAQRQTGGEIAIWLLMTVGALLIPIIVIAVCCIRRHCWKTLPARRPKPAPEKPTNPDELLTGKSPLWTQRVRDLLSTSLPVKLLDGRPARMTTKNVKQLAALRSYDGPYIESGHETRIISSENTTPQTLSRTSSIKKQHVHWPDRSGAPKGNDLRSIKDRQFSPRKQPFVSGEVFNTTMLTESPSTHRRPAVIPAPSSALSHLIQTAIMPTGSAVGHPQQHTPTKQPILDMLGCKSTV